MVEIPQHKHAKRMRRNSSFVTANHLLISYEMCKNSGCRKLCTSHTSLCHLEHKIYEETCRSLLYIVDTRFTVVRRQVYAAVI